MLCCREGWSRVHLLPCGSADGNRHHEQDVETGSMLSSNCDLFPTVLRIHMASQYRDNLPTLFFSYLFSQ